MKPARLYALAAITLSILAAACSSNVPLKENKAPIEEKAGKAPELPAPQQPDSRSVATIEPNGQDIDPLNDPKGVLANRSIYFDYDSYEVKDTYRSLVEAHSKYLLANKSRKILIQGNTDERGGSEYNLALGQRRADSVKKLMTAIGVPEASIESVSLGKEKPKVQGSNEEAWAENRRADLVYQ
jgi:peptidoglycan-associated lipoprotein